MDPLIASSLIMGGASILNSILGRKSAQPDAQAPALQSRPVVIQSPYQNAGLPYQSLSIPQTLGSGLSSRLMPTEAGINLMPTGRGK